jgi:hypothetical protein
MERNRVEITELTGPWGRYIELWNLFCNLVLRKISSSIYKREPGLQDRFSSNLVL